jgi:riboflavin kinase/FMN adenylyltransferase
MKILALEKDVFLQDSFVALGTFDGLHVGHEQVIRQIFTDVCLVPTVLSVLPDVSLESLITLREEKEILLQKMGVAVYVPTPLSCIRNLSPEEFFERILVKRLKAKKIACGFNFRFGKNAAGDTALLAKLCKQHGIELFVCPAVCQDGETVSSSRIRTALQAGDILSVTRLLGRNFGFCLPVIEGNRLGNQLGFPTINQQIPGSMVPPKFGVYGVSVTIEGKSYAGVCNVGVRPTVGDLTAPMAETHILDFAGDLYGKTVDVRFLFFVQAEKKFGSLSELKTAIGQDSAWVREHVKQDKEGLWHENF